MAAENDIQSQVELSNAIAKAGREYLAAMEKATKQLSQQADISKQMQDSLNNTKVGGDGGSGISNMTQDLQNAADGATNLQNNTNDLTGAITDASGGADKFGRTMRGVSKSVKKDSFSMVGALQGIANVISGLPGMALAVGKGIFNAFGKASDFLMGKALEMMQSGQQITQAWEKVRGEFGNFEKEAGAIKDAVAGLNDSGSALTETGLGMSRIFGYGAEGLAAQIEFVAEMAKGAGERFSLLADEFASFADEAAVLNKAMGVSGEAIANLAMSARANGETVESALQEVTRMGAYMEKTMGVSAKAVGKNFNEMATDIETFGGMSRKEMMATAAFAAKLGVSVKGLQGIVGKTDDFESAAKAAADLGATFGMQIDAMNLMAADPGEKLQMIKDSFNETGKSFEQMSRQEKARLAEISGMDVKDLGAALDPSNAAVNLEDFQTAAEEAAEGAITQEEANLQLAKSIEKMTASLEGLTNSGFLDNFLNGVMKGLMMSPEFREILKEVGKAMKIVFDAGMQVGAMLGEAFGPNGPLRFVKEFIMDYFNPEKMKKRMEGVVASFRKFFDALKDPKKAVTALGDLLKDLFGNIFGGQEGVEGGADKVKKFLLEVFDKAFGLMLGALPQIINSGVKLLKDVIKGLTKWLNNSTSKNAGEVGDSLFPTISAAFDEIGKTLKEIDWWGLAKQILDLFILAFKTHPKEMSIAMGIIFGYMFGPAIIGMAFGYAKKKAVDALSKGFSRIFTSGATQGAETAGPGMISRFTSMMKSLPSGISKVLGNAKSAISSVKSGIARIFTKGAAEGAEAAGPNMLARATTAVEKFAPGLSKAFGRAASTFSKMAGPVGIAIAIASVGLNIAEMADEMGPELEEKFGKAGSQAGIAAASVVDALTLGLLPDDMIKSIAEFTASAKKGFDDFLVNIGLESVVKFINTGLDSIFNSFRGIGNILSGIFTLDGKKVAEGFHQLFDGFILSLKQITIDLPLMVVDLGLKAIEGLATAVVNAVLWMATDGVKSLYNGAKTLVNGIIDGIVFAAKFIFDEKFRNEMIEKAIKFGSDLIDSLVKSITDTKIFKKLSEFVVSFGKAIFDPEFRQQMIDKAIGFGMELLDGIIGSFTGFTDRMTSLFSDSWQKFKDYWGISSPSKLMGELGQNLLDGLINTLLFLPTKMLGVAEDAWNMVAGYFGLPRLQGLAQAIIDGIVSGLKGLGDALLSPFKAAWGGITSMLGIKSPSTEAADMGQHIVDGLAKGLADLMPKMVEAFDIVFNKVLELAQNNILRIVEAFAVGLKMVANLILDSGITDAMNSVSDSVFKLGSAVVGVFEKLSQAMIEAVKNGILAVADVISQGMNLLAKASSAAAGATSIGKAITNITSDISGIISTFVMQSAGFTERGITEAMNTALFADALYNATKRFERVAMAMESTTFASAANALQNFQEVVAQFNDLQDQIAHGDPINIATMLDRFFNEGLGLKGEKISVKREPVNITINLNVSMKTEDVAKVMVESSLVTKGEKYDKLIADDF